MQPNDPHAAQRTLNRTRYAIEDWYDASRSLRISAFGNFLLACFVAAGLLSGAENLPHVIAAVFTGAGVLAFPRLFPLARVHSLPLLLGLYLAAVGGEYTLAGLPEPPLPGFTVENGWAGFLPFANSLSPLVYLILRTGLVYPIVHALLKRRSLAREPISTLRQLDPGLAGQLE